jgi:NAD(P)-dependent dehydrogenase (short-subunit alcohol dehydrogenase family)
MANITASTVFLVSGGARGITARCVVEMARYFKCKFILLGRSRLTDEPAWAQGIAVEADLKKAAMADMQARGEKPTPPAVNKAAGAVLASREIRETLDAVKQAGGEAVYVAADITDAAKLREAISGVSHLGRVTAILHGAGNLADKLIENKTEADFENVYSAKVAGLENLLAAVPAEQIEALVLFSSVAGFYGNVGQADYAIANEILNKTAHRFKAMHPSCHVVSINWGPWDGGMVTPQLRAYFDALDIKVIPVEVGARMLIDELRAPAGDAPAQIVIGSAIRAQATPPAPELTTHKLHRKLKLADSPFLGDHVVNAQAVMPMVSAMSWMASAAEQIHRGFHCVEFDNYRVLKGIVFDETLAPEYTLELKETAKSADEIKIEAMVRSLSAEGKPRFHYSTALTLRPKMPEAPIYTPVMPVDPSTALDGAMLYQDGTLFHGPSFQGVAQVLTIGPSGLVMRCVLPDNDEVTQGQFPIQAFNYFMADIGLQSIGVWARRMYDMGSLPLRAGHGEFYRDVPPDGTFYTTMDVRAHSETNVTADITLYDSDNKIYMIITELEVTMSKRLNELFLKNRLPETAR